MEGECEGSDRSRWRVSGGYVRGCGSRWRVSGEYVRGVVGGGGG